MLLLSIECVFDINEKNYLYLFFINDRSIIILSYFDINKKKKLAKKRKKIIKKLSRESAKKGNILVKK